MTDEQTGTTLRDQISQSFDQHEQTEPTPAVAPPPETETAEQKEQRLRDEQGRFVKQEKPKLEAKSESKPEAKPEAKPEIPPPQVPRPPRPSSWKKEMWDHWDKIDPTLAEYLSSREQDFAKGVSTYKQEADAARPLIEAMAEFQPLLQQHNIDPSTWIKNLGNAHRMLATGSPEQKLSMFARLAQDYQVPLQGLFTRGQDGQIYLNPQIQAYQALPQQEDPRQVMRELLEEEKANQEVMSFASNNEQYPFFEQLKEHMAGLLQAGLAPDLKSAYDKALRLNDDLFQQSQQQQREKEEQVKRERLAKEAQGAKAKAVSPKTSTPVGTSTKGERKDLRGTLEQAFDEVVPQRV